jgi:hypothetical protein
MLTGRKKQQEYWVLIRLPPDCLFEQVVRAED